MVGKVTKEREAYARNMKTVKKCKKCNTKTHKNDSGKRFVHRKSVFRRFWGAPWVPGGLPGRPGSLPEAFQFVFDASFCLKTGLDRSPGGSGEVPGHLQGPPRNHFGRILNRFLKSIFGRTAMTTLSFGGGNFAKLIDFFVTPFMRPRDSDEGNR